MATTQKSLNMAADMAAKLTVKSAPMLVTQSSDSDGNPVLTVSADATPVAGEAVIVIRIKPETHSEAKDLFGNAAINYGPHVIQLCTEANFAGATDNVADILTLAQLAPVMDEVFGRGCTVEWYQTANATVPSIAAMIAANLKSTQNDLYWKNLTSQ
jgi:hypothetical protein